MMSCIRTILMSWMLLFTLTACAAAPEGAPMAGVTPAGASQEGTVRTVPEYRLGTADKVRVNVFGEEALTGEFTVGGSGKISLPLLGEVQAMKLPAVEHLC